VTSKPTDPLPEYLRPLAGQELRGGYRIQEGPDGLPDELGRGKWAYVFNATGPLGDRKAVKVLQRDRALARGATDRFREEIDKLILVRHPNVVSIETYESVTLGDLELPYYIMEICRWQLRE
jgi:hypothetical protein